MERSAHVWAVELRTGVPATEREGRIQLDRDRLRFDPLAEGQAGVEIPFRDITKARRVRGSPVLMVIWRQADADRRTAFYFVQPPPIAAFTEDRADLRTAIPFRNPKRKARRDNVGYLGFMNREKKAELVEWERELRAAVAAASGR